MARTFKGRRIGETYIKCNCVGVTSESGEFSKYIYEPVCGTGNIVVNTPVVLNDDVVPMEHLRMKAQVDILTELNYPVEDICRILGAPEYLIDFYLPGSYAGLNRNNIYNEFHRINARCTELKEAMESEKAESHRMYKRCTELLKELESERADRIQFEQRGKELTEENNILTKQLADLRDLYDRIYRSRDECIKRVKELGDKNARLSASLDSEEEANDVLTKRIAEAEDEISELKRQYETLNMLVDHCGIETYNKLSEENANLKIALESVKADNLQLEQRGKELTEKVDELSGEYIRVCKARDEHIKHINALERKVKELEHEKRDMGSMYACVNEELCKARVECEKLKERINAYSLIVALDVGDKGFKLKPLDLDKWIHNTVTALHQDGKTVSEIADILKLPVSFITHVLEDF